MFIETHAHYCDERFDKDRKEVLEGVFESGVDAVIECATDLSDMEKVLQLVKSFPGVYGAMGVHPHAAGKLSVDDLQTVFAYATAHDKVVAIGEIGLDYHYDFSPRDAQQDYFTEQLELAVELELPVIVHSREAAKDTYELIRPYAEGAELTGVIHAFSGSWELAESYVKLGFYLGIGGMLTFPDTKKLLRVVQETPLQRLLLETDSPYLAPVPRRGERNDSRNLVHVARKIAELKGISVEEVAKVTSENAKTLFGLS